MSAGPMHAGPPRVWVLEDPRAGTAAQAVGIAERLGLPFRLVAMRWNWMAPFLALAGATLGRRGSLIGLVPPGFLDLDHPPALVISAGTRAAAVALWLRGRFGCRIVHCMKPQAPLRGWLSLRHQFDLLVLPEHDRLRRQTPNVLPVRGGPHRMSPARLERARADWAERLAHLPHPRVALLVGGPVARWFRSADLRPAAAHNLARLVGRLALEGGGCVLASTSRRTGQEGTDALAAGLSRCLHVLYRWGEPGENPYTGFLASADAIVVTADSVSMISEACAADVPVFIALPELAGRRQRRLIRSLLATGQVRLLDDTLSPWPRRPLDETGAVAAAIWQRFGDLLAGNGASP